MALQSFLTWHGNAQVLIAGLSRLGWHVAPLQQSALVVHTSSTWPQLGVQLPALHDSSGEQTVVQFPQWFASVVVSTQVLPQQVGAATVQMDGYSQIPAGLQTPAAPWHGPGVLQVTGVYWQVPFTQ